MLLQQRLHLLRSLTSVRFAGLWLPAAADVTQSAGRVRFHPPTRTKRAQRTHLTCPRRLPPLLRTAPGGERSLPIRITGISGLIGCAPALIAPFAASSDAAATVTEADSELKSGTTAVGSVR